MSGPVDVLAYLDSLATQHAFKCRAGVAELIEGARRAQHILALHDDRCPQLDAALKNVGSAS